MTEVKYMTAQKSSCSPGPNNYPVPGPGTKHHPAPSAIVFICHTAILRGTGALSTADAANTRFVSSCSDYDMTAHVSCSQFMPLRFHRSFLRHSPLSAAQQRCHVSRVTCHGDDYKRHNSFVDMFVLAAMLRCCTQEKSSAD